MAFDPYDLYAVVFASSVAILVIDYWLIYVAAIKTVGLVAFSNCRDLLFISLW